MENKLHHKLGIFGSCPVLLLQDKRLSPGAIKAYLAIQSFEGTSDVSWPSRGVLAKRAGMSEPGISKATGQLVETGWLLRQRRFGTSNVYRCLSYSDPVAEFDREDRRRSYPQPERKNSGDDGESRHSQSKLSTHDQSKLSDVSQSKLSTTTSPVEKNIKKLNKERSLRGTGNEKLSSTAAPPGDTTPPVVPPTGEDPGSIFGEAAGRSDPEPPVPDEGSPEKGPTRPLCPGCRKDVRDERNHLEEKCRECGLMLEEVVAFKRELEGASA